MWETVFIVKVVKGINQKYLFLTHCTPQISTSVKILQLQHDVLRTQSAVTYLPAGLASANQASKVMGKSIAQTSTNAKDLDRVESMPIATTVLETTLVCAEKASKEIHMMDVQTSTSVRITKLVDRVQYVQILRVVIAATALKVSTEMPDQQVVLITMNVPDHLAVEMRNVPMKSVHSGATAQKDL